MTTKSLLSTVSLALLLGVVNAFDVAVPEGGDRFA